MPILELYGWLAARPGIASLVLLTVIVLVYLQYRRGFPKPLPGIPYNTDIGWLGDIPSFTSHIKEHNEVWTWAAKNNVKHQSPLTQIFIRPFTNKPTLVLSDPRESQDILLRRVDEWDRSTSVGDYLRGVIPKGQITLTTGDEWRAHRNLMKDLMTPAFLQDVSAPAIYHRTLDLVRLWQKKAQLAQGAPFLAGKDVHFCALDAIFDAAFGTDYSLSILHSRLRHLEGLSDEACYERQSDGSVEFVEPPLLEIAKALHDLDESTGLAIQSPSPLLTWRVLRWAPWFNRAWNVKEKTLKDMIDKAVMRMDQNASKEPHLRSALDNMIARERSLASKSGRQPDYYSRAFYDELYGYVLGGHDTTSTTTQWAVKFLAKHPDVQTKFREELFSNLQEARSQGRQPTAKEIVDMKSPYVDATLEELLRHSVTIFGNFRVATRDTTVLGHHVPKGTEIMNLGNGPGCFSAGFHIEEGLRSETSRKAYIEGKSCKEWDPSDISAFKPERWLVEQDDGTVAFDKLAGLHLTFGLGVRGCFGRRLAELEFKLFICLFVWNLVFEPIEGPLSSEAYVDMLTRVPKHVYVRLSPVSKA